MVNRRIQFMAWIGRTYNYNGNHEEFSEDVLLEIPFARMRIKNKLIQYRKQRERDARLRGEMQLATSAIEDVQTEQINRTSLDLTGFYGSFIGERIVSLRQILKRDWLLYKVDLQEGDRFFHLHQYPQQIRHHTGKGSHQSFPDNYFTTKVDHWVNRDNHIKIYRTPFNKIFDAFRLFRGSMRYRVINGQEASIQFTLIPRCHRATTMRVDLNLATIRVEGDEVLEFEVPFFSQAPYKIVREKRFWLKSQSNETRKGRLMGDLGVYITPKDRNKPIRVFVSAGEDFNVDLWECSPWYYRLKDQFYA